MCIVDFRVVPLAFKCIQMKCCIMWLVLYTIAQKKRCSVFQIEHCACVFHCHYSNHSVRRGSSWGAVQRAKFHNKANCFPPDLAKSDEVCVAWNKGGRKSSARGIVPSEKKKKRRKASQVVMSFNGWTWRSSSHRGWGAAEQRVSHSEWDFRLLASEQSWHLPSLWVGTRCLTAPQRERKEEVTKKKTKQKQNPTKAS